MCPLDADTMNVAKVITTCNDAHVPKVLKFKASDVHALVYIILSCNFAPSIQIQLVYDLSENTCIMNTLNILNLLHTQNKLTITSLQPKASKSESSVITA